VEEHLRKCLFAAYFQQPVTLVLRSWANPAVDPRVQELTVWRMAMLPVPISLQFSSGDRISNSEPEDDGMRTRD